MRKSRPKLLPGTARSMRARLVISLDQAFSNGVVAYAEDPCGAEEGFSGREHG